MYYSPLRYPGGKAKLSEWFVQLMRQNGISGGHYIEPYAGGSGVALHLLIKGYVNSIHINDFDKSVYLFWYHVLYHSDELIDLMMSTPVNMDSWYQQREVFFNPEQYNQLALAFAFFFLNRTNRSGIIKGGVIGGKSQEGNYKIDARFNKSELANRIKRIARLTHQITLTNLDSADLLDELEGNTDSRSLIYLDPPYYQKGQKLYLNAYNDQDHSIIADKVRKLKTPWVITYDNHPRIKEIYHWSKRYSNEIRYSANARRIEKELVYCGNMKFYNNAKQLSLAPVGLPMI